MSKISPRTGAALFAVMIATSVGILSTQVHSQLLSRFLIAAEQTDGDPDPMCGNGVLEGTERCDDGNTVDADGCDALCTGNINAYPMNLRLKGPTNELFYQLRVGESIMLTAYKQIPVNTRPTLEGIRIDQLKCTPVNSSWANYKEFRWTCLANNVGSPNSEIFFRSGNLRSNSIVVQVEPNTPSSVAASSSANSVGAGGSGVCGNANVDPGEVCDTAGNSASCDSNCTLPQCGDGLHNAPAGEACDTGGNTATCDSNCTAPHCGDSLANPAAGEQCDDGNTINTDGCNNACQVVTQGPLGNLYVSQGRILPSRQLLGSTVEKPSLEFKLRATNEAIRITQIKLTASGTNYGSLGSMQLFLTGSLVTSNVLIGNATVANCGTQPNVPNQRWFCANFTTQLGIPTSGSGVIFVRPNVRDGDNGGLSSTSKLQIALAGTGAIQAQGMTSGHQLTWNDVDGTPEGEIFMHPVAAGPSVPNQPIIGAPNMVVMSEVISITNANPDPNGTNVPAGDSPVGRFQFRAANHRNNDNQFTLSGIIFTVTSTNVLFDATDVEFYNQNNTVLRASCTARRLNGSIITGTATGTFLAYCTMLRQSPVDTAIDMNASEVFVLELDVLNPQVNQLAASSLQVSMQNFNDITRTSFRALNNGSFINWVDIDNLNNATKFTWIEYPSSTVNSTNYTTAAGTAATGNLYVQRSRWHPWKQLLGSTIADTVLEPSFRAEAEDIAVTMIKIKGSGANVQSVDSVKLYFGSGAVAPFATATTAGCGAPEPQTFCAPMTNQFIVQAGQTVKIIARPVIKSSTAGGQSSNSRLYFVIPGIPGAIQARGMASSNNLAWNDADIVSNEGEIFMHTSTPQPTQVNTAIASDMNNIVMSKVISLTNANPDPNGTNAPTGDAPIGQFRFETASHNNTGDEFTLSGVILQVIANNASLSTTDIEFYNQNNNTQRVLCKPRTVTGLPITTPTISGTFNAYCTGLAASIVDTSIGSNSAVTFVLELDILNPRVNPAGSTFLSVRLQGFTDPRQHTQFANNSSHIHWLDVNNVGAWTGFYWMERADDWVYSTTYD